MDETEQEEEKALRGIIPPKGAERGKMVLHLIPDHVELPRIIASAGFDLGVGALAVAPAALGLVRRRERSPRLVIVGFAADGKTRGDSIRPSRRSVAKDSGEERKHR